MIYSIYILLFFLYTMLLNCEGRYSDGLCNIKRIFISSGIILEPTVKINDKYLFKNDNSSVFGGFKICIDGINSVFNDRRVGFIYKGKVFFSKLMNMDLYTRQGLKDEFVNFTVGIQLEIGLSVVLNKGFKDIRFDKRNRINRNISSLNFLVGLKEELGKINEIMKASLVFPTKLLFEAMYILDLKYGFSFYLSVVFFQCFSPVYLFSFNKKDFGNVFNNNNFFNWNINIEFGLLGQNFFI